MMLHCNANTKQSILATFIQAVDSPFMTGYAIPFWIINMGTDHSKEYYI